MEIYCGIYELCNVTKTKILHHSEDGCYALCYNNILNARLLWNVSVILMLCEL